MIDYVERLTSVLAPTIMDLDNKNVELKEKREKLESISHLLDYIKENEKLVSKYPNQDLIINNLKEIGYNEEDYHASCYLLDTDIESVKGLPQYEVSKEYLVGIVNYFKRQKEELTNNVNNLELECEEKKLNKKYYDIFNSDKPLINDVDEFNNFLDKQKVSKDDRVKILFYVIKNNVDEYKRKGI